MSLRVRIQEYRRDRKTYKDVLSFTYRDVQDLVSALKRKVSIYCEAGAHDHCDGSRVIGVVYGKVYLEVDMRCKCQCHQKIG